MCPGRGTGVDRSAVMNGSPVALLRSVELRLFAGALASLVVAACIATGKPQPRKDLLAFIADGQTGCPDVIVHLGDPAMQYEEGRLITYRIAGDSASRYALVTAATWEQANYSLVIRCDAHGVVEAHALVAVKGP